MGTEQVDLSGLERKFNALMEGREQIMRSGLKARAGEGKGREYAFRFLEEYAQWRYEHRAFALMASVLAYLLVSVVLLYGAWLLASTSIGQGLGLDSARSRVTNAYYAVLWATRGVEGAETAPVFPPRYSGAIERIIGDVLVVVYYDSGKQIRRLVRPANVITTDQAKFKAWATQYHLKGLSIEFYEPLDEIAGHQVWGAVMWYRKTPINVELVEQAIGYPEKNPPTAVVNQIFSQYYWHKARAGK